MSDFWLFLIYFRQATHLVRHILCGLFLILLGCAMIVKFAENQPLADALYFTLITGLTVGYGDISPVTPAGRIASVVAALIGVILTGIYVAIATHSVLQAMAVRKQDASAESPGPDDLEAQDPTSSQATCRRLGRRVRPGDRP